MSIVALSDGRGDGVEAAWSRDGAIAATTSCAEHLPSNAVRTASRSEKRPPTTRSPGDDAFE